MAFREVTMLEIKEVLRLWLMRKSKHEISRIAGVDRNTARRYIKAAQEAGVGPHVQPEGLDDNLVGEVIAKLDQRPTRSHCDNWIVCEARKSFISEKLSEGLMLSKIHRLLHRHGAIVPYSTLYRYAVQELDFGRKAATIPVADCAPGAEVQLDTGWMTKLEADFTGKKKRFKAWIFTSVFSRHRFVYPILHETTQSAIDACEEAWVFFGGIFKVVIPDNTKAIVSKADSLDPIFTEAFLEYAQARGFVIDPARVRHPQDKARVERAVTTVREDCFRGEVIRTIPEAKARAITWCRDEYGARVHSTTQRIPLQHFEQEEKSQLLPPPSERYDVPLWTDPKVGPDQLAMVAKALYSLPFDYRKKKVQARVDSHTVRFYYNRKLIKVRARQQPGGRDIDAADFPPEKAATALRDVAFFQKKADEQGPEIGRFAAAVLSNKMPWTRLRRVYALLGLCRRYGPTRVNDACKIANAADMADVRRLERMIKLACPEVTQPGQAKVIPLAKYLRPTSQYALPLALGRQEPTNPEGETK